MASSKISIGMTPAYVLDAAKSRFQVRAFASGLLSSFGHNPTIAVREFAGEASFRADAPEQSTLLVEIQAASLAVTNDVKESDRRDIERTMQEDVLEIADYPEIRFEGKGRQITELARGMFRVLLAGSLSLHGVERNLEFPCNLVVSDNSLRANGEFTIRQTDFGIKLVSVAGGALKLKDELKFQFDIVANRRLEASNG